MVAAAMVAGVVTSVDAPGVEAKGRTEAKGVVACPGKVGSVKFEDALPFPQYNTHKCRYRLTGKNRIGSVSLEVQWWPDHPRERSQCLSRTPQPEPVRPDEERWWRLSSGSRMVVAHASWTEGAISVKQAAKALRQLISAAEPLGHPCVPDVEPTSEDGVACPLVLPGDLVRGDWHTSHEEAPVIEDWLGFDGEYVLRCRYRPAYRDEPEAGLVRVSWAEDDPSNTALCFVREDRGEVFERWSTGHYPVEIEIATSFVRNWPRQAKALTDSLAAAAAARSSRCPDAPDGPAPYEPPSGGDGQAGAGRATTIMLSGGPGDEPPVVGTTIDLPPDDQYEVVIGGPGGEVIREGFIGDRATIAGYGATVTDADGNWVVLVTVDVTTAPDPTPLLADERTSGSTLAPAPEAPTAVPTAEAAAPGQRLEAGPTPAAVATTPAPIEGPSATPVPAAGPEAIPDLDATAAPDGETLPDTSGVPDSVAAFAKDLPPAGAAALRTITNRVAALGGALDESGQGELTIPASDIAALRALAPDVVNGVRPSSGTIEVDSKVGKILVTPIIGTDGLIEFRLNRLTWVQSHDIVRALVVALNSLVADRGGRFRLIQVTPEGIMVTAVSGAQ